jgi:hypothetical protein
MLFRTTMFALAAIATFATAALAPTSASAGMHSFRYGSGGGSGSGKVRLLAHRAPNGRFWCGAGCDGSPQRKI